MNKSPADMSTDGLEVDHARLKEGLCDLEEMHSYALNKTSIHIGVEKAQNMQAEFEEECREYEERIAENEKVLKNRGEL